MIFLSASGWVASPLNKTVENKKDGLGCFGKIFGQHRHPMDDVTSLDQIGNEKEELKLKLLANLENKLRYIFMHITCNI